MNRKIVALALGTLVVAGGACSKDEATTTSASTTTATPTASSLTAEQERLKSEMPTAGTIVPVPVTKPKTPTSVDPALLPQKAKIASNFQGLKPDEKICIEYTIHEMTKKDPSILTTDGKLAGLGGQAVATCTGPERATEVARNFLTTATKALGKPATEAETACLTQKITATPDGAASIFSAVMTASPTVVMSTFKTYETTCKMTLVPTGPA